jgi:glucose/arabinose dehydrogenase
MRSLLSGTFAALALFSGAQSVPLKVVATDLNNPRKIFVGSDGAVYVVEAGTGGRDKCLGSGASAACIGLSGSITRIANGAQKRTVTALWSGALPSGKRAQGPAAVIVRGDTYYVLLQNGSIDSRGVNALGPDGATAGDLITTPAGKAVPDVLFNFAAFEAARNPDHGAGPGAKFGNPAIDSDPYAFAAYRGGFAVADAAGNDLLWINPKGGVSVLAVFPTQTVKLTSAVRKTIRAPRTMTSISVQSVPSSVAVGPDGALYVGELTGVPFKPGTARIWRVVPGKKPSVYASGFTNISDIAFAGKNLLVLELAVKGLLAPPSPGALIRLAPNGKRTVIASAGLVDPSGLAVGSGSIYISNYGLFPGTGAGPHGEVVSLPASLGS